TGRATSRRSSRSCGRPSRREPDVGDPRSARRGRLLRISSPRTLGREVDDEIRFHIDARTEELVRQGLTEAEAREQALTEYGDIDASRRELATIDQRRLGVERREEMLMTFVDDLAYAARSLARRPALLIVTVLTLSI